MTGMLGPEEWNGSNPPISKTEYDELFIGIIDTERIREDHHGGDDVYYCYSSTEHGAVRASAGAVAAAIRRCLPPSVLENLGESREEDLDAMYDVLEENGVVFELDKAEERSLVRYEDLYEELHRYLVTTNNRYRTDVQRFKGIETGDEELYNPDNQVVELISQARFSDPTDPDFVLEEIQLLHKLKESL